MVRSIPSNPSGDWHLQDKPSRALEQLFHLRAAMSPPQPPPHADEDGPAEVLLPQEILAQFQTVNVAGELAERQRRKSQLDITADHFLTSSDQLQW